MAAIEEGRICVVTRGRRAGQRVTITKIFRQGFVQARDDKGKERKYSIQHLEALGKK